LKQTVNKVIFLGGESYFLLLGSHDAGFALVLLGLGAPRFFGKIPLARFTLTRGEL